MSNPPNRFIFVGYEEKRAAGVVTFHYELERTAKTISFRETLSFDPSLYSGTKAKQTLIDNILKNLLLLLGINYWKTYCPESLIVKPFTLTEDQAKFWNTVYTKGLGEFFYENKIDFRNLVRFPFGQSSDLSPSTVATSGDALVQLGGGKDSIVTSELLKKHNKQFRLITVNPTRVHSEVAYMISKPLVSVMRTLDPILLRLNKEDGVNNGHVPVSAMYAFVDLFIGALQGVSYIVASNEESANYGNVTYLGSEINHQWSKSLEFEELFREYVRTYITADITYFSLLRPMKEIKIVEIFSKYEQYFDIFTSCNTNFRIGVNRKKQWCGRCPKCAFVFTPIRKFVPKNRLVSFFQKNLFDDMSLLPSYRELLGLVGIKPFECVGTPEESKYALFKADESGQFVNEPLVRKLKEELGESWSEIAGSGKSLLSLSQTTNIPEAFLPILKSL